MKARPDSLAERTHEANRLMVECEGELVRAVTAACGRWGGNGDEEDLRTDGYDNSIEVWGVGDIDLEIAARKLKEHGFERVWLHRHRDRISCTCLCR